MATFIPFTEEQKQRANSIDLADFLRSQGEEVVRSGHEYRWKRHDSVTISGNRWFRHSTGEGGCAIDFARHFYHLSFPEAVTTLLGGEGHAAALAQAEPKPQRPAKPFRLPERNDNNRRLYAYLMKQRGIDADVISHFVRAGTLYEDNKYHNAVFVGVDEYGKPHHAHKKSTYTLGESFRANVESSDARFGFGHIGKSDRLYVFEAPIDMMSFITLYKQDWQQHSYLTLNGVSEQALLHTLKAYGHLQSPILCLDNDKAGLAAMNRIAEKLKQLGYESVSQLLCPCKDWNELLCDRVIQEQREEPVMTLGP